MPTVAFRCLQCNSTLNEFDFGLECSNGHRYFFVKNTRIPIFAKSIEGCNEYSIDDSAEVHDNALRWLFKTFGGSENDLRHQLVSRLRLKEGQNVLVTGVGAGNDLPFILEKVGATGSIYAQDYSVQMLMSAVQRSAVLNDRLKNGGINFSVSDAVDLPFHDCSFDAAYHFGGINLFSDVRRAIFEMNRVVKPGGRVVIGDEGLAPWVMDTEIGKMIIANNPLCRYSAPLSLLPSTVNDVTVSWELSNYFYVIDFSACIDPPAIDPDVWHIGYRGGSMKTRYYGVLEGIDPELKKKLYEIAASRGLSRVDLLHQVLKAGLDASET